MYKQVDGCCSRGIEPARDELQRNSCLTKFSSSGAETHISCGSISLHAQMWHPMRLLSHQHNYEITAASEFG